MDAWNALRPPTLQSYTPVHLGPNSLPVPPGPSISSAPHKRKPPSETGELFAAGHPPKRRQSAGDTTISTQRVIQPKPSSNGQSPPLFASPLPGQPKKRGRPSKAEVEARNADLVARGHVLPPQKVSTPRSKPPELAPREPDPMQQRDASFFSTRPSLPPILSRRAPEGPAPDSNIIFDSRPAQGGSADTEAADHAGTKTRPSAPKQATGSANPREASSSGPTGAHSQPGLFETIPPVAAQVQTLAPRPADQTRPVVEESPTQVTPITSAEPKAPEQAQARSST